MSKDQEVTWVEDDICVCNNCGAHAESPQKIKHFETCQPGEAKKWEKFYSEEEEDYCGLYSPNWDDPDWVEAQEEVELAFDILVHTTGKAYLLQFGEENVWFPMSKVTLNMSMHKNTVLVPRWLMIKKGLEE